MYDLIVIGAGPGGYEAAAYAAKMGRSVALVEKDELGGTCLNVGCIPTKTFLRSAKAYGECKDAADYGISVSAPAVDMAAIQERKKKVVATLIKGVAGMLKSSGVEVIRGTGRIAGRGKVEVDGTLYEAANILIATGSVPMAPPIPEIAARSSSSLTTGPGRSSPIQIATSASIRGS